MIKIQEYINELDRLNVKVQKSLIKVDFIKEELAKEQERLKRALSDYKKVCE